MLPLLPLLPQKKDLADLRRNAIKTQLVVVIPSHDEPNVLDTLHALLACRPPPCRVDVMVVINGASNDPPEIKTRNRLTLESVQRWIAEQKHNQPPSSMAFHYLFESELPPRQAGVGTARKMGMDWALTRFDAEQRDSGVIVCLDADCTVAPNYLETLHTHFQTHPKTPGCSIYFEHPLADLPEQQRMGIIHYELFLRYYRHALCWSGFPYAFHTVGSSMAVRAGPYRRQGGMNRRKAGEDFYFLQKIIPLGHFSELCQTTVFPSARPSLRVPFGTGRTIHDGLAGHKNIALVYNPLVFQGLKQLFMQIESLYHDTSHIHRTNLPQPLQHYLEAQHFTNQLAEIRAHTSSLPAFRKRFFHGFNALRILKYVHFATEHGWAKIPVWQAASTLWAWMKRSTQEKTDMTSEQWLERYRYLDKNPIQTQPSASSSKSHLISRKEYKITLKENHRRRQSVPCMKLTGRTEHLDI